MSAVDIILILWVLQALYGWFNLWLYRIRMRRQNRRLGEPFRRDPMPAIVMVPMKGVRHNFEDYIDGLLNQDYPDYHLVFTVESTNDPLYPVLRDRIGLTDDTLIWTPPLEQAPASAAPATSAGLKRIQLIPAGLTDVGAQKVHNQLRALRELRVEDEVIVGCDADIVPPLDMLSRLLSPINHGSHVASTGYRWLIPMHRRLGMHTASVINSSVATMGGPEWCNLMWGGAHAVTREMHEKIGLVEKLKGAFNDDLQIAHHIRAAGEKISYLRSLMLASPEYYDWKEMFTFGWRQYFHVRFYAPWAWWMALLIGALYIAGSCVAWISLLSGSVSALIPIGLVFLFNQLRANERIALVKTLFAVNEIIHLRPTFRLERFATLFWMSIHFLMVCRAGIGRTVTWSGIAYRVRGRQDVTVVSRAEE